MGFIYFVNWKLGSYERKPKPDVVSWDARPSYAGSSRSVEVTAKVRNAGGTGAVTLVATLYVGKETTPKRETVVIASDFTDDFRFVFSDINAQEASISLSLAGDPWGQLLDPARERIGRKIEF